MGEFNLKEEENNKAKEEERKKIIEEEKEKKKIKEEESEDDEDYYLENNNNKNAHSNISNSSNKLNQTKKQKTLNLMEINEKLNELNNNKINIADFNSRHKILSEKLSYTELKIAKLISTLFGDKIENVEDLKTKNRLTFVTKEEFDKNRTKNDEEITKIWEKINKLKLISDEIDLLLKEKASLKDLESMQLLILQKIEELFMQQNKKFNHNSSIIQILQDQFKKLLELLSRKEEEKESLLIRGKPISGYSCASCETYIGDLKNDPNNRYVHWNKFPEKNYKDEQFYKVHNGYSRLLQMINFDSNGKMTLNPFSNNDNNNNSISSKNKNNINRSNEPLNKSLSRGRSVCSVRTKRENSKEKYRTIDTTKQTNEDKNTEQNLPLIKVSGSVDNFDKLIKKNNDI